MQQFRLFLPLLLALSTTVTVSAAAPELSLQYLDSKNKNDKALIKELKDWTDLQEVVELVNEEFKFRYPVRIVFGAKDGPLYDPDTHRIEIPYAFITETIADFKKAKYQETGVKPEEGAQDALLYSILHELAHVLIAMYEFPVLGQEEDAADNLATMMLIEYFDGGDEVARSAADLFDILAEMNGTEEADYWDEHKLDVQRANSTLCHIYGSNPKQHADIAKDYQFDQELKERCVAEYENIVLDWDKLLDPIRKKG